MNNHSSQENVSFPLLFITCNVLNVTQHCLFNHILQCSSFVDENVIANINAEEGSSTTDGHSSVTPVGDKKTFGMLKNDKNVIRRRDIVLILDKVHCTCGQFLALYLEEGQPVHWKLG